jgi:galactonate dehydratase
LRLAAASLGVAQIANRRRFLKAGGATALALPGIVRAQSSLQLDFLTIPDPDGWHPSLRLKGDWLVFAISDGVLTGYGEASHSRDDARCRVRAAELFTEHYAALITRPRLLSLEWLAAKEQVLAAGEPDFVSATALSGINQALYDLLAKQEQVPVWQLFERARQLDSLPLYTTINRALQSRTRAEYFNVVSALADRGFATFKCAPFEAVVTPNDGPARSAAGLRTLTQLRDAFSHLAIRVDFHERFLPQDFYQLLEQFEQLALDWLEEPFPMGEEFAELRRRTSIAVAAGELFWGASAFLRIADNGWADVIMPDVKHVGGFGPLLDVIARTRGKVRVSPHNPSGPISTAASLHAAALNADVVESLEYAFDRKGVRQASGEQVSGGRVYLSDAPGWGVVPPAGA